MSDYQTAFKSIAVAAVLAVALLLTSCSPHGSSDGVGAGSATGLVGAGATFPNPIYQKWVSDYQKVHPQIKIDYQSIGSGGGIKQIKEQTVDFGASDSPMTEAAFIKHYHQRTS